MSETFEQWKANHPSDTLVLSFDDHMHRQWRVELYGNVEAGNKIKSDIRYSTIWGDYDTGVWHDDIKSSHPFIQGDSGEWLMVEFWSANQDHILRAAEILAERAGLKLEIV